MSVPKLRYVVIIGPIVGVSVAIAFYFAASGAGFPPDAIIYFWPSSIMLMATETLGRSAEAFGILALSIALNGVLYMFVAVAAWLALRLLALTTRRRRSAREV